MKIDCEKLVNKSDLMALVAIVVILCLLGSVPRSNGDLMDCFCPGFAA